MSTVVHSICIFAIISIKATKETSARRAPRQGKARQGRPAAQQTSRRDASSSSAASSSVQLSVSLPLSHCDRLRLANIISLCRMWQWIRINKYTNTHTHRMTVCVFTIFDAHRAAVDFALLCVCVRAFRCVNWYARPFIHPLPGPLSLSFFTSCSTYSWPAAAQRSRRSSRAWHTQHTHANTHTKTEWMAG